MDFARSKDSEERVGWSQRLTSLGLRVSYAVSTWDFEGDGGLL